ncbi:hypothetical protein [Variovorax sp. GT1P44]|uniref:hypothetical protein n=1 Tax=Variovorax sp. GT1P44 TaxID=3443742 RepID=UPI003F45D2E8
MSKSFHGDEDRPLVKLHAITHARVVGPLLGDEACFEDRLAWLRDEVGDQAVRVSVAMGGGSRMHLVCTSMLSKVVTGWDRYRQGFIDALTAQCGDRPAGLVQAYQCAGWGYAIRFAAQHTDCRWLTLTILDVDLHELFSREYEVNLGTIGCGVTTVGLELPSGLVPPDCDGPLPNHGFTDMLHALRARRRATGPVATFLPFMPEGLDGIARRSVGDCLAPNRHADYGHCFGADPWIGVLERLRAQPQAVPERVTLGSFAFSGYYAICDVQVGPWTSVELRRLAGGALDLAGHDTLSDIEVPPSAPHRMVPLEGARVPPLCTS